MVNARKRTAQTAPPPNRSTPEPVPGFATFVKPARPSPDPLVKAVRDVSAKLEASGGRVGALRYVLDDLHGCLEFERAHNEDSDDGANHRAWLFEVVLDALAREADRLDIYAQALIDATKPGA